MQCPRCGTDNVLGVSFCRGCGAKLELTDDQAQLHAVASVKHENWQRAFKSLNRTLYLFVLALIGSLAFRGCARSEVAGEFGPSAPLPPAPALVIGSDSVDLPDLALPQVADGVPLAADGAAGRDEIVAGLAATARQRLNCILVRTNGPKVRGQLLGRTDTEILVIAAWTDDTPSKPVVRRIPLKTVDLQRSQLPE
jgi:hypothetical protein